MKIAWSKYRFIYAVISGFLLIVSAYSLLVWGLKPGVEFTGGTIVEYSFVNDISTEEARGRVESEGIEVSAVQSAGDKDYIFKLSNIDQEQRKKIRDSLTELSDGDVEEKRFEMVGPTIGPELVRKTLYAMAISAGLILAWVGIQFKSVKFGISAILAMLHDTFNLVGLYALLGYLFGAEVDFLFVTALLTTLSFSVHDTIVVYDRIREIRKKHGGDVASTADRAVSETMRRSINNSVTIVFMLLALTFFGGSTIKWFSSALLIGTILGTYSSPFVAVPILVTWEQVEKKLQLKRKK